MLVEIPDVGVMIGVFVAFVSGLFAIIIYNKVKPLIKSESEQVKSYIDRLQYYETQLIDMKIRMDSLELDENESIIDIPVKADRKHTKLEHEEIQAQKEPQK
jgi:hypothetical protein